MHSLVVFGKIIIFIVLGLANTCAFAHPMCAELFNSSTETHRKTESDFFVNLVNQSKAAVPTNTQGPWLQLAAQFHAEGKSLEALQPSSKILEEPDQNFLREWQAWAKKRTLTRLGTRTNPIELIRSSGNSGADVFRVNIRGKNYFFRPFNEHTANTVRKTITASWLNNEILNIETVAHAELVEIWCIADKETEKMFGSLSEEAPGQMAEGEMLKNSPNDNVLTAWAFEFLIGNSDARSYNFNFENGRIIVFDHGHAFQIAIENFSSKITRYTTRDSIGADMPPHYTSQFLAALRTLQRPEVIEYLKRSLTSKEFQAFQIRLQLINIAVEHSH